MRRSVTDALRFQTIGQILSRRALRAHFQPIASLADGTVLAHEALIRGPTGSPFEAPDALFRMARDEGRETELERACLTEVVRAWLAQQPEQRLFVNLSARAIVEMVGQLSIGGVMDALHVAGVAASAVVVEITEHEQVGDPAEFIAIASALRAAGLRFALDDFGSGHSSLRLWAELRPEFVKIDKYFVREVDAYAVKVQTLKGLTRFAETFGTHLVAEGIETDAELQIVRDLGIAFGQGYFLGRPQAVLARQVLPTAAAAIANAELAVLPQLTRAAGADFTVEGLAIRIAPIAPELPTDEVAKLFAAQATLRAVALVDDGRPVGLLNRQAFVDRYARPYFKELFGRKPCALFANAAPLLLEKHLGLDAMTAVLTSSDQRYLTEGFIVTDGGRYLGLGTGEQLVRVVTEARIEAARHANPLTFLPGNIPISEHVQRLLTSRTAFTACYCDLNDFKPFNDCYGYARGDEMIRLVARTLVSHCDPRRDFVGHIGGDDFVMLFQSEDWLERCRRILETFNDKAIELFDAEDVARGGIDAEDRHGVACFYRCTTLSIGAVPLPPGLLDRPEQVAAEAAAAKHDAKAASAGLSIRHPAQALGAERPGINGRA